MVEWKVSPSPVPYEDAVAEMITRVKGIQEGQLPEQVWLLEHPSVYTAGTSANEDQEVVDLKGIPLYQTGRGGKITYHGPGQRVGYVMLNLKNRKPDIKAHVHCLEEWVIQTLDDFGIRAERRPGRIGLWVAQGGAEKKIAAIGVRVQKWVTFHGIALNINPDLGYFKGIIPCGLEAYGVTSLAEMGIDTTIDQVDKTLKQKFEEVFKHD